MRRVAFAVNGARHELDLEPRELLVYVIRDRLGLTETKSWIGESVARKEDRKLLTGQGSFVDNMQLPGTLYMAVVRSPYAHARIVNVDVDAARDADGVVAAFSGAALMENWKSSLP